MTRNIVLLTINARYEHAALGLRYLKANLGELSEECQILEFTSSTPEQTMIHAISEAIHPQAPAILGLGIAIWNVTQMRSLIPLLRQEFPHATIVAGGPEVSYGTESHPIFTLVDHVIQGEADLSFPRLCRSILDPEKTGKSPEKLIASTPCDPSSLVFPYSLYTDQDLATRFTYVEASRGCPFSCEFCLSSLEIPLRRFPLEPFLAEIRTLFSRGARRFKFIDRTFNLSTSFSVAILQELLPLAFRGAFFHFEIVPDRLAPELLSVASRFPPGSLQFEVGIQSFNREVAARIGRKQDFTATERNLSWLRSHSHVHLHADLIVGLPGESEESFAAGFDRIWRLQPHEIQVGILKRLHGAPIARHDYEWSMRYSETPPYEIISTSTKDASTIARLRFFARALDLFSNRGRFPGLMALLIPECSAESPYTRFLGFCGWLSENAGPLHGLSLDRQFELLARYLLDSQKLPRAAVLEALGADYHLKPGRKEACLRKITSKLAE